MSPKRKTEEKWRISVKDVDIIFTEGDYSEIHLKGKNASQVAGDLIPIITHELVQKEHTVNIAGERKNEGLFIWFRGVKKRAKFNHDAQEVVNDIKDKVDRLGYDFALEIFQNRMKTLLGLG